MRLVELDVDALHRLDLDPGVLEVFGERLVEIAWKVRGADDRLRSESLESRDLVLARSEDRHLVLFLP